MEWGGGISESFNMDIMSLVGCGVVLVSSVYFYIKSLRNNIQIKDVKLHTLLQEIDEKKKDLVALERQLQNENDKKLKLCETLHQYEQGLGLSAKPEGKERHLTKPVASEEIDLLSIAQSIPEEDSSAFSLIQTYIDGRNNHIAELKEMLSELENEILDLRAEDEKKDGTILKLKTEVSEKSSDIERLSSGMTDTEKIIQQLQIELRDKVEENKNLEISCKKKVEAMEGEILALEGTVKQKERDGEQMDEINGLKTDNARKEKEIKKLQDEIIVKGEVVKAQACEIEKHSEQAKLDEENQCRADSQVKTLAEKVETIRCENKELLEMQEKLKEQVNCLEESMKQNELTFKVEERELRVELVELQSYKEEREKVEVKKKQAIELVIPEPLYQDRRTSGVMAQLFHDIEGVALTSKPCEAITQEDASRIIVPCVGTSMPEARDALKKANTDISPIILLRFQHIAKHVKFHSKALLDKGIVGHCALIVDMAFWNGHLYDCDTNNKAITKLQDYFTSLRGIQA